MLQKYRDTETQIRNNQLNTGQFWVWGKEIHSKYKYIKAYDVWVWCVCVKGV